MLLAVRIKIGSSADEPTFPLVLPHAGERSCGRKLCVLFAV